MVQKQRNESFVQNQNQRNFVSNHQNARFSQNNFQRNGFQHKVQRNFCQFRYQRSFSKNKMFLTEHQLVIINIFKTLQHHHFQKEILKNWTLKESKTNHLNQHKLTFQKSRF